MIIRMRRSARISRAAAVSILALAAITLSGAAEECLVTDEALGAKVALPDATWTSTDVPTPGAVVRYFYSPERPEERLVLVRVPGGQDKPLAAEHAAAAEATTGKPVRIDLCRIAAMEAERVEFREGRFRVIEFWFRRAEDAFLAKIAAPEARWRDADWRRTVRAILESLTLEPRPVPAPVIASSPAEIRRLRAVARVVPEPFEIRHHDIRLSVDPGKGSLSGRDLLKVRGRRPGTTQLRFRLDHVKVDRVSLGGETLPFTHTRGRLDMTLSGALGEGEPTEIEVAFHSDCYLVRTGSNLLPEVRLDGQVTSRSSYSSGVAFYPVDARNDATARIEISVPEGYVAVSGGRPLGARKDGKRTVHVFEFAGRRPRPMPFGFAVGRYETLTRKIEGELTIELAFPLGEGEGAGAVLDRLAKAAKLFEETFGPLPWRRVAAAVVMPIDGIEGVSLPGLLLASPEALAPTLEDELSHQWHFYAAGLPNELSEGLSVFTDLLLDEARDPKSAQRDLRNRVRYYLSATRAAGDAAVADPRIYTLPSYSAIAFHKVPAALCELRGMLGEVPFRRGLKRAVGVPVDDDEPWTRFRRGLERGADRDLAGWFTDRFFRPGVPKLEIHGTLARADEHGLDLTIRQLQEQKPMTALVEVEVVLEGGERIRRAVLVTKRKERLRVPLPAVPSSFRIDPDATGLFWLMSPVVSD